VSDLFSSPTKQATSAANAENGINQSDISQLEDYSNTQEQNLRTAISGTGDNPYFKVASTLSPTGMAVNPNDTTVLSNSGPGTVVASGATTPTATQAAPIAAGAFNPTTGMAQPAATAPATTAPATRVLTPTTAANGRVSL
jgi:hypothetical protein